MEALIAKMAQDYVEKSTTGGTADLIKTFARQDYSAGAKDMLIHLGEFLDFVAKENYISTTLAHEPEMLWQKIEVIEHSYEQIPHPEITTDQLIEKYFEQVLNTLKQ